MITSKLPNVGTSIFATMSALARQHEAINLSQGFPNFDPPAALKTLVAQYLQRGFNQYAPMGGVPALTERIADKVERDYGARVNPATEITITSGATEALYAAITALVGEGDEVIVFDPAYDSYRPAIALAGGKAISYPLLAPHFAVDWQGLANLLTDRTRLIIINTPHNPTGAVWSAADWQALADLVRGTKIAILSDEAYEHLIFDGAAHQSILRRTDLWERTLAAYSFGKTFHSTGWKMGYLIAPAHLTAEFRKIHQFVVFSVNTPIQYAIADFMDNNAAYFESLPHFYQTKRDAFAAKLAGSGFRLLPCGGTYFQVVDYSALSDLPDTEFANWLTIQHKVATIPVSVFYENAPSHDRLLRICFAKTDDLLTQAADILCKI